MKPLLLLALIILFCSLGLAQTWLTPLDFGLKPADHGRIDYRHTPPNILVGHFNTDCYPDIARFTGNKLEIYIFLGKGYSPIPQGMKSYLQPIRSLALTGDAYVTTNDLTVTLSDGTTDTLRHHGGCLDLQEKAGFLPLQPKNTVPPRYVSEFDFQQVWASETRPYGMDRCAVGNLDSDSLNELVTWWKESYAADTAYMLIYKCTGNNQYELFMQEPFWTYPDVHPVLTSLMIDDIDQNGHKELIYTRGWCYFWEFYNPGVYFAFNSNLHFYHAVWDFATYDVNRDSLPEIVSLSGLTTTTPPCAYIVHNFVGKNWFPEYTYAFNTMTWLFQNNQDARLAVGDFDNDGAADIVSGNTGWSSGYPYDIKYFRYDSTVTMNFTTEWLQTGIPLTCATPVIADLDGDGQNELFAGGHKVGGNSAFIWEPTGFGTGYVAWQDTTSQPGDIVEGARALVDEQWCAVTTHLSYDPDQFTQLILWGRSSNTYATLWSSPRIYNSFYRNLCILDMDEDGKQEIILANSITRIITDWEQNSAGIEPNPIISIPETFELFQNYPNPFNNSTMISYSVSRRSNLELIILDLQGREVLTQKYKNVYPGAYEFLWNAADLSSGLYFIKLASGNEVQIKKAVLIK